MSKEMFFCDDGSLAAAIPRMNEFGKIEIMGISDVEGMGCANYEKKLFEMDFDEIRAFNSFSGISFIAVKKDNLWGLIRLRWIGGRKILSMKNKIVNDILNEPYEENKLEPLDREVKMIEKPTFQNIDTLLEKFSVNKIEYLKKFTLTVSL
jgi:hypothetical protein